MSRVHFLVALVTSCALLGPNGERALGVIFWNVTTSGTFNTPSNWSPNIVPGSGDVAFFNVNATYTVTFQNNVTNSLCEVDNGTVTFALGGATYTTTSTGNGDLIGSTPGQTGRLTVTNGNVSGDFVVGSVAGATGSLTISSDATWDVGPQNVGVGESGVGTMTVNSGGHFTMAGGMFLGSLATGNGTLSVTGSGSSFACNGLEIGNQGIGDMTVSSGGSATAQGVTIAAASGSVGSLTVTGSSSLFDTSGLGLVIASSGNGQLIISSGGSVSSGAGTVAGVAGSIADVSILGTGSTWTTSGQLIVGSNGTGTLSIGSGGSLNTNSVSVTFIGSSASGNGSVSLSGNGATWTARQSITVGSAGTGKLTVESGATLTAAGGITIGTTTGTMMTMNGGTVDVLGFTRNGTFNFNDGTLIDRGTFTNASAAAPLVIDGNTMAALPTLQLIGNFSNSNITSLTVGNVRQGALLLSDRRTLDVGANNVSIGAGAGSSGSVTLSGNLTQLSSSGTLAVGGSGANSGGTGVLTVGSGSTVNFSTLNNFAGGTVNLNGGTIFAGTYGDNGGTFNWTSGTLVLPSATASLTDALLTRLLGGGHSLTGGQQLFEGDGTTLNLNGPLNVNGGAIGAFNAASAAIVNNSVLSINSGAISIFVSPGFTNNAGAVALVQGTGLLNSPIVNNGTLQLASSTATVKGVGTLTNNGTVLGTGSVLSAVQNNSAGSILVTTGQRLAFGGTVTNAGVMSLVGGEMQFNAAVTNSANTGLMSGREAILRFNAGLTNNGSIAFSNGTMDVFGDITSNHFVNSSDRSRLTVSGGGVANFYDDVTVAPGQTDIQLSAAGTTVSKAVFFGSYNGGSVGGGTAFLEGDHRPGNSPGVVTFGGDLAYGGLATLHVEIGGTTPGTGPGHHDQVNVAGVAALDGTLDLAPFGGFVPISGDKFVVMTYASASGAFASVTGTTPAPGLTYTPVYSPTNLTILTTTTGEKTWAVDSSGNASLGTNWTGGIAPGGVGDSATLSTIITAPRVVTLDADTTVGTLKFDSPISYTLAGPHTLTLQAPVATAATINVMNTHGNGAHTISAPITLASELNIVQNSSGTFRLSGPIIDAAAKSITKAGSGTLEITAAPTLGANTAISVSAGTLRFAATSGSPTIGTGVQINVTDTATLELAGSVSALSTVANRANIANGSLAGAGILVSGTSQIVGKIDGNGSIQVNAGSDLTASRIVQGALAIGGTSGSPALVTIAASDEAGGPLGWSAAASSEFTSTSATQSSGPVTTEIGLPLTARSWVGGQIIVSDSVVSPLRARSAAAVPEPQSIMLVALGSLLVLSPALHRRQRRLRRMGYSAIE